MTDACPVSVRGRVFPSHKAAAKALGVKRGALASALYRRGHCDTVGLPPSATRMGNTNAPANETVLFGHRFRSRLSAAKALGVNRNTIRLVAEGKASQARREIVYSALMRHLAKEEGR
ncbi:hypothetical protein ATO8_18764 [Roseivivax marinus]|uniref:Nuclease-associated modular DNA-binding 1 domain-containing protein n=1 Tax=Roseivivax marinus TaxID=1379903 RepID=W4HGH1_9RHOB|nr:NUMOD1 domain-containing DNA-binding protein [Roseivivax marinus]ETW11090.1 hypothetical protein ATO8_18764 [Roseivivax marinus]